jgi:hypothetical protein
MIVQAFNSTHFARVIQNVRGIVFLGTPHRGSDLAKLLSNVLWAFSRSISVDQLRPHEALIREMNGSFVNLSRNLRLVSYYESRGISAIGV